MTRAMQNVEVSGNVGQRRMEARRDPVHLYNPHALHPGPDRSIVQDNHRQEDQMKALLQQRLQPPYIQSNHVDAARLP